MDSFRFAPRPVLDLIEKLWVQTAPVFNFLFHGSGLLHPTNEPHGDIISAQVLNEFTSVMRRKYARSWREIETAIDDMRGQFDDIRALTAATHASALALAREIAEHFHELAPRLC